MCFSLEHNFCTAFDWCEQWTPRDRRHKNPAVECAAHQVEGKWICRWTAWAYAGTGSSDNREYSHIQNRMPVKCFVFSFQNDPILEDDHQFGWKYWDSLWKKEGRRKILNIWGRKRAVIIKSIISTKSWDA